MRIQINSLKHISKWSRHNSHFIWISFNSCHCMGFSCTSLTISEYSTIISLKYIFNDMRRTCVINIDLLNIPIKHFIECELFWCFVAHWLAHKNFTRLRPHIHNDLIVRLHFFLTQWSTPNYAFDCLSIRCALIFEHLFYVLWHIWI